MIQRYDLLRNIAGMYRNNVDGDYVTYADHIAAITPLVRALRVALRLARFSDNPPNSLEELDLVFRRREVMGAFDATLDEYKEIA